MRKKWMAAILVVSMVAVTLCGCGSEDGSNSTGSSGGSEAAGLHAAPGDESYTDSAATGDSDGGMEPGEGVEIKNSKDYAMDVKKESESESLTDSAMAEASGAGETYERVVDDSYEEVVQGSKEDAEAGMLTAGEWCDNDNWGFYTNLFSDGNDWSTYKNSWDMDFTNRIAVTVTYKGKALRDAKVELEDAKGNIIWQAVSDSAGKAYVFYNVSKNSEEPKSITVSKLTYSATVALEGKTSKSGQQGQQGQDKQENKPAMVYEDVKVDLEGKSMHDIELLTGQTAATLDLMYIVDTTGSMTDELTYLQMELKDVVQRVQKKNAGLDIRISTNFYRDKGDDYEVKSHPFTKDLDKVMGWVNDESADGGGDYPEAVDKALEDALNNHDWQEDSVKLAFLVLDAPPHNDDEEDAVSRRLQKTIKGMAQKGIRVIPVASSGVDKTAEFICRKFAVATGGTYTFLTDDSGIGDSHIEPTIGSYDVKKLNDLMEEIISRYL